MTAYRIKTDAQETLHIADGDTVTVYAGVSIIDPSVTAHSASEDANPDNYSGIQNEAGGHNHITILGTVEGHAGVFLDQGSNYVLIGDGGYAYGANSGVEFYDGGFNVLTILAGGKCESDIYGAWFGAHPHVDPNELPNSGNDTVHNAGIIEGDRREALRMALGGNQIVNSGTIVADLRNEEAILIQSNLTDSANQLTNTGTIQAGSGAASVIGGDAALAIDNTGTMTGDIDFGAGNDRYAGSGAVTGIIDGGGGGDKITADGAGGFTLEGGAGADYLRGGASANTFVYNDPTESSGAVFDTIDRFDFAKDAIQVDGADVTAFTALAKASGLAAGGAGVLSAANGVFYLLIDANGVAGYQAGQDYDIKLTHAAHLPGASTYKIAQDSNQGVVIAQDNALTLYAGVQVADPSVNDNVRTGLDIYAGIQDTDGGGNRVTVYGTAEGFVGAWFWLGSNAVSVKSGGTVHGYNAGVEFHDGGNNFLSVEAGGTVSSHLEGVWFGAFPHVDYTTLPDSGFDTVHNAGLIEGERRDAIRMVLGGNHIVNAGAIQADYEDAVHVDSGLADPVNAITNAGTITAGPRGVAIFSGDAAMAVTNTGAITGDIQFGAGADRLGGLGTISGSVFGGDGDDRLAGGTGDVTFSGGNGSDYLRGGTGVATFVYTAATESTGGVAIDTIDAFDFAKDHIQVNGVDVASFATLTRPSDLAAGGAGLIEAANDVVYLLVDANGVAGYQAGSDYDIKLTHAVHIPASG
ncbi:MAG TPA: hypothetical protein VGF56_09355 [Rhizomicrobium sp.]|jgi:hypothetical protein